MILAGSHWIRHALTPDVIRLSRLILPRFVAAAIALLLIPPILFSASPVRLTSLLDLPTNGGLLFLACLDDAFGLLECRNCLRSVSFISTRTAVVGRLQFQLALSGSKVGFSLMK